MLEQSAEPLRLTAVMWVVKEAVIKALWQQVQLSPGRIEVLPRGDVVTVTVHHADAEPGWIFEVEISYPDDQVMAVVMVVEEE